MKERPLDSSPFFSTLLVKERSLLSKRMETQNFSPGEVIFAQGALSEVLYLIESGWVRLTREEKGERLTIATLGPGDLLDEEGFLLDRPYSVSAEATSEVTARKLAKADLLTIVREEPQIGVKLSMALGSPVAGVAVYLAEQRLARTSLFSPLPSDLLLDMARRLRPKGYERGETICQAGDPGGTIYMVESGRVEALPGAEGEEVSSLGEGGLFGERAVLTGVGYGATYRAATRVTVWALSRDEFGRLAQAHPLLRRAAGEHLREKVFGPPVAAEPGKAAVPWIRLSLLALRVSLGQGVRILVAAFRDLVRWQAHQRRAVRVQLGVVVLLVIWFCGISAPTAVISSMTGGEGMAALLAAPTLTFTPSPVPTDTPTTTPTFTPMPTHTPVPSPTATPTELAVATPTETPVPTPTAIIETPVLAAAPTATPVPPTATPTPISPPVVTRVYDHEGNPKDTGWAWNGYGVSIDRAAPGPAYRVVELREKLGSANIDVWVLDEAGQPIVGAYVRMSWPGEDSPADLLTGSDGNAGSGELGKESCYRGGGAKADVFSGSLSFEVLAGDVPSDVARGFGWICGTNHNHMEIVFQLVR